MIDQTLGHYRIQDQLGAGGMGVVYCATDSKLGRQVAIKVLPEKFAKDPERLARFEREARLLAALNHPNIAAIHGLEEAGGVHYLVLEFVPGETLKGPLPLDQSLPIARQIAEALEAAHDKGIVHRDLKPANIKITPEGKVKVLDFGLAKAVQGESSASVDLSQSPTVSLEGTREGVVMGTAGYMSPEQARGAPVDKRADIWAFGCVLYEALSGQRAFAGETLSDSVAAVLTQEPKWDALPASSPPSVQRLLRRCLQKDPRKRLRDIGDARLELEEPPATEPAAAPAPRARPTLLYGASLAAGALLSVGLGWILWHEAPQPPAVARFTISLPPGEIVSPTSQNSVALSRDGAALSYVANRAGRTQFYLRRIDQLEAKPIPGTENAVAPVFSPDGQWLAFLQGQRWKKVALSGGAPVTICNAPPGAYLYADWTPDDHLLFGFYPAGILQVPATGGEPRPLFTAESAKGDRAYWLPHLLPGGKGVLFSVWTPEMDSYDDGSFAVQPLPAGPRKILVEGGHKPVYSPSGHLVYARAGQLLAAPFDLTRLAVTGPPVPVLDGVLMNHANGSTHFSLSANGSLAYVPGGAVAVGRRLVWVDRQGKATPLSSPARRYLHPRISPDGRKIAVETEGPNHDLWTYEPERDLLTRMSFDGTSHWPLWTPDGKRLTFRNWRTGDFTMWWMPADRSGPEERLTMIGVRQSAASWSPDGRVVAFNQVSPDTSGDVYVLEMDAERKPRPLVQTKFNEGSPRFSPDGRYLAYASNESGRMEVFVTPYPGPGAKIQISTDGGADPAWRGNGGELYYRNGDRMMVVGVTTQPSFRADKPRVLWEGRYNHGLNSSCGAPGPSSSNYDVTADGQRFLMVAEGEQDVPATRIHVVLNWTEELKKPRPAGKE
jgi:serine/threonine-protein kinase